jgi:outer membrane protein TolC
VNLIYFAILLGEKNIEQLMLTRENLQKKFEQVSVTVKNGAALQSNSDQIQAEIIKTEQRITEAKSVKEIYVKSLEILIHEPLDPETLKLETPANGSGIPDYNIADRPDLILLQQQQMNFEAMKGLTKTGTTPKLGAFLQLGYGRPALNPLSTHSISRGKNLTGISGIGTHQKISDRSIRFSKK